MCSCTNCKNGHFSKCTFDTKQIETDVENEELSFLDELENVSEEMISIVEVGSFVGIHKYSSTKLEFVILKVLDKKVAINDFSDVFGNIILKGEIYMLCHFLKQARESDGKLFFKELRTAAYLIPANIICPFVAINETDLSISVQQFHSLCEF